MRWSRAWSGEAKRTLAAFGLYCLLLTCTTVCIAATVCMHLHLPRACHYAARQMLALLPLHCRRAPSSGVLSTPPIPCCMPAGCTRGTSTATPSSPCSCCWACCSSRSARCCSCSASWRGSSRQVCAGQLSCKDVLLHIGPASSARVASCCLPCSGLPSGRCPQASTPTTPCPALRSTLGGGHIVLLLHHFPGLLGAAVPGEDRGGWGEAEQGSLLLTCEARCAGDARV